MKSIVTGILVSVLGLFAAGCAEVDRKAMEPMAAPPPGEVPARGAISDVCSWKVLDGLTEPGTPTPDDVMVLLAVKRSGAGTLYLCNRGLAGNGGPGTGKPAQTRPGDVPDSLDPGEVVLLPTVYRKLKDSSGDPCIELGGGGSRAYYCW